MTRHYLHLSVYPCDLCAGPVVAGSTAVRENEIQRETNIQQVGAICLSCGHRQDKATAPAQERHLPPIAWAPAGVMGGDLAAAARVEALNHAELHELIGESANR
jgi:hypothetical protein